MFFLILEVREKHIFLISVINIGDHPSWNAERLDCPPRIEIVDMI